MSTTAGRSRGVVGVLALAWVVGASPADAAPVRVGLVVDATSVVVGGEGAELAVSGDEDGAAKRARTGPLRFGLRQPGPPQRPTWEVRAAVESTRKKADLVRTALASALHVPLRVERGSGGHAVLAGPFEDESRARAVLRDLEEAGIDAAALIRSEPPASGAARLVMVTGAWDVVTVPGGRAHVEAPDHRPVELDGVAHRGEIDVFVNERGLLTVTLEIDLEDYLRGVVPSEMGPEAYPALEALKAQAVAARTYALMPSAHATEGFDRCARPHCQVYGGVAAEHELTNRAVQETGGLVLTWEGRPIHAYFSSTCGGHTENVANVFDEEPAPYLRGVPCYPEKVDFLRVPGRPLPVDFSRVDGRTAHGVLARLLAAGVVTEDESRMGVFSRRARSDEAAEWLARSAAVAGRSLDARALQSVSVETALAFVRSVLRATATQHQEKLIATQDLAAAARFREFQGLSGDDLSAALLALKAGLLPEGLDPGWGSSRLSRGNILEMLEGWLRTQGFLQPPAVRYLSARSGELQVLSGAEAVTVPVASGVLLLSGRKGAPSRLRDVLELKLGDRLRIHRDADGAARCIELEEDPDGAALDRTSSYSWWTKVVSREQLARNAADAGIAGLKDLEVTRTSPAGRVIALRLTTRDGSTRDVERFAARQILGVPDLRCDVRVDHDPAGELVAIAATGRGWGHGVGLCQVGAFGMALLGRRSSDILEHYYPGTRLEPMPSGP